VRLAIADDSGLFRDSLRLLLEQAGAEVTVSAASGPELLAAIRREGPPDAVVLDIRMRPSLRDEGITTAVELRQLYPGMGILLLSAHTEIGYASRLLDAVPAGVGYLLKDNVMNVADLMAALGRVAEGGMALEPTIVQRLLSSRKPGRLDALNERERDVLQLMAEGGSNLGIAQRLFLSPRTVEAHVTSIFSKLGLDQSSTENNRVLAVLTLLRAGSRPR
jgi:DNA-binding NarL/FixJ family response regulator